MIIKITAEDDIIESVKRMPLGHFINLKTGRNTLVDGYKTPIFIAVKDNVLRPQDNQPFIRIKITKIIYDNHEQK